MVCVLIIEIQCFSLSLRKVTSVLARSRPEIRISCPVRLKWALLAALVLDVPSVVGDAFAQLLTCLSHVRCVAFHTRDHVDHPCCLTGYVVVKLWSSVVPD